MSQTEHLLPPETPTPPIEPPSSEWGDRKAYIHKPHFVYTKLLSFFFLILCLPVVFLGLTRTHGVVAPPSLAHFASSNPRVSSQIATIISSILSAGVRWALAGVVTIRAQKHYFKRVRPMYKIEVFSALKNGGVAWSWNERPGLMYWTSVVVGLSGLLTSGFAALISPFPIAVTKNIPSNELFELDFSSANPRCALWQNQTMQALYANTGAGAEICNTTRRYLDTDLVYTTCFLQGQYGQVLNAATSSMNLRFAADIPRGRLSNLVTSFPQLANTHIIGSTAGTLPTGPAGVHVFSDSIIPVLTPPYNYTLNLQGIWASASCSYVTGPESLLRPTYPRDPNDGTGISYNLTCPSGEDVRSQFRNRTTIVGNGIILAGTCINANSDDFTFHLRTFWGVSDPLYHDPTVAPSQYYAYAGIHAMECTLSPRIGPVTTIYQTNPAAFNMTPSTTWTPFSKMEELAKRVVSRAMWTTLMAIDLGQTGWNGNIFGGAISNSAIAYGNLTGAEQNPIVLNLVADALKGIFEYQVTHQRLVLTAFDPTNPDRPCFRMVTGTVTEEVIGWDFRWPTAVGLIPLFIIAFACIGVTIWTMMRDGELTVFDPTNPISLLTAASGGRLQFPDKIDGNLIGDPEDEDVKTTRITYGMQEDGRWGLKADKTE